MVLVSRRGLLAGAIAAGAQPRRKRHRERRRFVGMQPDQQGVFFQLIIQGGGEFTYDAAGNLRTANVGQTTTDPIQGITCYAGFSTFNGHGAVISLFSSTLDAQLWYTDTGTSSQGVLMSSVAAAAGTDPFGNAFLQGITVYVFSGPLGLFIETVANAITFGSNAAATRITNAGQIFANDALTDPTAPQLGFSAPGTSAGPRASVQMTGESKDTTAPAQMVVGTSPADASAAVTSALLEVHGNITTTALASILASGDVTSQLGNVNATTGQVIVATAGSGLRVKEGANAKQGTATLAGGTKLVANTSVTANSRIFLTAQDNNSTGALRVSARVAGTSFTITSSNAADSGVVAFQIFEPA